MEVLAVFFVGLILVCFALFIYLRKEMSDYSSVINQVNVLQSRIKSLETIIETNEATSRAAFSTLNQKHEEFMTKMMVAVETKKQLTPLEVLIKNPVEFVPRKKITTDKLHVPELKRGKVSK